MVNTKIKLKIFFAAEDRVALYSQHKQDMELTLAQVMNFLLPNSDLGETIKPFRYDLNQIPYNHTVEVTNRFKGLDLVDRVPEELRMEVDDIVQETGIKTIPKKKKWKKAKSQSEEALQIVDKIKVKSKGDKEIYTHLNTEFQRIAWRDKKAFFNNQWKEIEEIYRIRNLEISLTKLEISREYFMQRWAQ